MKTWTIPPVDVSDPAPTISISAMTGRLTLELGDFDGFIDAKGARRMALALNQAALELDACRPLQSEESA